MSNIDNIVDMTIKRVHTNNKMNSITDNSRLINELQLQEEPVRLSSRELFKTSKFYRIVLIINMIVIIIAMIIAGFGSLKYKSYVNECFNGYRMITYETNVDNIHYEGTCNKNDFKTMNKYNEITYKVPYILIICLLGIDIIILIIGFFVDRQSFSKLLLYFLIFLLLMLLLGLPLYGKYKIGQININYYIWE